MFVLFPDLYLAKVCGNAFFVSKIVGTFSQTSRSWLSWFMTLFLFLRNSGSELVYKLDKNMYAWAQTWGWQELLPLPFFYSECKMPPRKVDMWKSVPTIPITWSWQDDPLSLVVLKFFYVKDLFGHLGTCKPLPTMTRWNAKDKMHRTANKPEYWNAVFRSFWKHDIVIYVLYWHIK